MKKQVSLTPVLAIGLVIILVAAFFALISPKRNEASRLDSEIAALETEIALGSKPVVSTDPEVEIDVADLFRLSKAMPDADDMPGIILELNAIASSAGVRFVAIQPQAAVPAADYHALPITLTFEGNYYDLTDFLYRLRNLVSVKEGVLDASGRLYTLDQIDMSEGERGFPGIKAQLTLSAYAFGATAAPGAPAPAGGATPPATDTTQTTTGTTTGTTTATTAPPPASPPPADGSQALGGTG